VRWAGVQAYIEELDDEATSASNALVRWLKRINYPINEKLTPAALSFLFGVLVDGFYEGVTINPIETRTGTVAASSGSVIDVEKVTTVANAGIQYIADINNKGQNDKRRLEDVVQSLFERMSSRYPTIIARGPKAISGEEVNG
jgi:hypothetical protein